VAADDIEARRRARAQWPITRHDLNASVSDDLSDVTTPAQRIAMMWPLAVEAWRVAGREIPHYARSEAPGRLFRAGEPRPDDEA
jgi:hypothetical protein